MVLFSLLLLEHGFLNGSFLPLFQYFFSLCKTAFLHVYMNYEELKFSKKGAAQDELRARTQNRSSGTSVHVKIFAPVAEMTSARGYGF